MLRLKEFEILTPETLEEVLSHFQKKNAQIIAGGTDLIPKIKRREFEPDYLISLSKIKGLNFIKKEGKGMRIGALTKLKKIEESDKVEEYQSFKQALKMVATPIIRNSATIGGNLLQDTRCRNFDKSEFWRNAVGYCLKKGGNVCQVAPGGNRCYAVFCSDLAPALIVLDAKIKTIPHNNELPSPDLSGKIQEKGEKEFPLANLYKDDGKNHLNLEKREILTEIVIPMDSYFSTYKKLRLREGFDFPEAGVALGMKNEEKRLKINIAISGINSGVYVFHHYLPSLIPRSGNSRGNRRGKRENEKKFYEIVERIYNSLKPMDNLYFPPLYRKKIVRKFLLQSFEELLSQFA